MSETKYLSTDTAACFSFNDLITKIKNAIRKKISEVSEEEFNDLVLKELKEFSINGQKFEYCHIKMPLGGYRWYVNCPKCSTPSLKLYLPNHNQDREQMYYCRFCHRLKNTSMLLGRSKKYEKVVKPLKHLERLRIQLMKRGITPEKARPILDEYDRIERELLGSPEYRLWKFQLEHASKLPV